jgi:hypothetical protein
MMAMAVELNHLACVFADFTAIFFRGHAATAIVRAFLHF